MTEQVQHGATHWSSGVAVAPMLREERPPVGPGRSVSQIIDTFLAATAAGIGDGAVFWPASGLGDTDRRPRVCHPDGALAHTVKGALLLPTARSGAAHRSVGATSEPLLEALLGIVPVGLVVPIGTEGRHLGHLAVFSARPAARYGPQDQELLVRMAGTIAAALAHADSRNRDTTGAVSEPEAPPTGQRSATVGAYSRLLDRMAEAEDQERHALGEAIHDAPIQQIVAGVVRLEYLRNRVDAASRQTLDEVTDLIDESLEWLRSLIVVSLTPPDLSDGIGPALAVLARQVLAGTGTRVRTVGLAHADLDRFAKMAVYRIFREALVNVARHAQADLVVIRIESRQGAVDISVWDDGVGGVDSVSPASRGLALMSERARHQGAQLTIDSPAGGGTTVTVRFQASARPAPTTPGALAAASLAAPPLSVKAVQRVLVCDDQKDLRAAVKLVLADNADLQVIGEAPDGDTCLQQVREQWPDVLIMDVSMPGGGPDLARSVKNTHPACHVIVFSGRADAATQESMLEAGADQYVVKSGRLRRLMDALARAT